MRKKLTGLLAVLACLVLLSACGGSVENGAEEIPEETITTLYSVTETTAQSMDEVVNAGLIEEQKSNTAIYNGLLSWEKAKEEIGAVDFTTDADGNGLADCFTEKGITADDDGNYIVTVEVTGERKSADLVATYDKDLTDYVGLVANVNYSSQELIQQAGMNTLLGMGTTFAVLILLSLIIALFGKILTTREKKKLEDEAKKEEEQNRTAPAPAAAKVQSAPAQTQDGVLVAVIAAAVAAYRAQEEPETSSDPGAFVVRKIRRIQRAH